MKRRALPILLSLASSLLLAPFADAAGMIVIQGGIPAPRPVPGSTRPVPAAKELLSFGLRLESADIKVEINEQVAKTYIRQTFFNDTDKNLDGTYLFPLPEDTTFSSFSLHIDGKPVEGKILEANEARQQYETMVRQMANPGLLEYADYKTVRARIFPIPPHSSKRVELEYTQVLKAENGLIKYNFPLKTEGESQAVKEIKISVKLLSKQGLRTIWSPSHTVSSTRDGDHKAIASYLGKNQVPDKDFILYYSVSDKDMSANLLTHKTSGEDGYFLLTLAPPVKAREVGTKDIVFVADISLSMFGERMLQNKKALKYLTNALNAADRFSIVQFNSEAKAFKTSLVPATAENKKAALHFIENMEAAGATNIGDALKAAAGMLGSAKDRASYIVLMTDGEPTVGETSTAGLLKVVDPKKDIRLFDFGVGYDVNTRLLNRLAEDNHGTSQYVEPQESLELAVSKLGDKIKSPVLSNVKLSFDGIQVKDIYPANLKDIFAGSQVVLLGKYSKGAANASCQLSGTINGAAKTYSFPLKFETQALAHSYLPRLWAMRRIAFLSELAQSNPQNEKAIGEIVALSKKYGIITDYTSFLVAEPLKSKILPVAQMPMPMNMPPSMGSGPSIMPQHENAMKQESKPASADKQMQLSDRGSESAAGARVQSQSASGFGSMGGDIAIGTRTRRLDTGAKGQTNSAPAAPAETGKTAVMNAKKLNVLKDSLALDEEKVKETDIKTVDEKTFYLRNGFWTDSIFDDFKFPKPEEIIFGSNEYFDLLKNVSGISKYLAVGRQVIVVYRRHCYKIVYKQGA